MTGTGNNKIKLGGWAIVFRSGCSARTSDPFGDDTGVNADGKRSVKLLNHAADNQRFFLTAKRRRCHWAALIWDECAVFYNERSGQRRRIRQWVSKRSGQVALRSSLLMYIVGERYPGGAHTARIIPEERAEYGANFLNRAQKLTGNTVCPERDNWTHLDIRLLHILCFLKICVRFSFWFLFFHPLLVKIQKLVWTSRIV